MSDVLDFPVESSARGMSRHTRGLLAAGLVVLCWSGFNIVSRFGSKGAMTPFDIAAMRFGVSGVLALPFFVRLVPVRDWPRYMVLALFGGLGYALFVYSGFSYAPTAHAGVFVNGGIPFWTVVIVAVLSGFRIPGRIAIALTITSAGLLLIAWESLTAVVSEHWIGDVLFLMAAWCWAVFGLLGRRWRMDPVKAMLGIASFSMVVYLPAYAIWLPKAIAASSAGEIALQAVYQGVIAALLAGGMYTYASQAIGVCQASMMLALVPGVSAVGAYFLLGESIGAAGVVGIVLVSVGALLCARR